MQQNNLDNLVDQAISELPSLIASIVEFAGNELRDTERYPAINLLKETWNSFVADTKRKVIYRIMVL